MPSSPTRKVTLIEPIQSSTINSLSSHQQAVVNSQNQEKQLNSQIQNCPLHNSPQKKISSGSGKSGGQKNINKQVLKKPAIYETLQQKSQQLTKTRIDNDLFIATKDYGVPTNSLTPIQQHSTSCLKKNSEHVHFFPNEVGVELGTNPDGADGFMSDRYFLFCFEKKATF